MKNAIYILIFLLTVCCMKQPTTISETKRGNRKETLVLETIDFAGFTWIVKSGYCSIGNKAGPGPNYFCGEDEDLWVDAQGRLHMRINYKSSLSAYGAVSIKTQVSGCGVYRYYVEDGPNGTPDSFHENVVLGLFTYEDDAQNDNWEVDVEITDWKDETPDYNLWLNTWDDEESISDSYLVTFGEGIVQHSFTWQPSAIIFNSTKNGFLFGDGVRVGSDVYPCPPSPIYARINFWLADGEAPDSEQEVIISYFEYEQFIVLDTPTDLAATVVSETEIDLEWTDNSSGESGVEIERKESGGAYSLVDTLDPESTEYEDTNLDDCTTYFYRVRTTDEYGEKSSYSSEVQATTECLDAGVPDPSLSTVEWACNNWDGYVSGTVSDMPAGTWHIRSWIKSNKWYCQGEDMTVVNGAFYATHGLWCTPGPGVDIYVAMYNAATDPWGTGDCETMELGEWPDEHDYLFGPFPTQ